MRRFPRAGKPAPRPDRAPPPTPPQPMVTTLLYSLLALDQTLAQFAGQYGHWLYLLLFLIIFAETGLVVMPFLPGDSILFISGTVVATAGLNVHVLVALLIVAAILGDTVELLGGPLHRTARLRQAGFALVQAGAPAPDPGVLRPLRRHHDHHRPVRADHPDVRAVSRGRGGHDLPPVPLVQRGRRRRLDHARSSTRAISSATFPGSRTTCRSS